MKFGTTTMIVDNYFAFQSFGKAISWNDFGVYVVEFWVSIFQLVNTFYTSIIWELIILKIW